MKKEDYTKYRGYILKNEYSESDKQRYKLSEWALIAQIDYDIGITIVDLFDKSNYIVCLRNPEVLKLRKEIKEVIPLHQIMYYKFFNCYLFCIEKNTLFHFTPQDLGFSKDTIPASIETCVFS